MKRLRFVFYRAIVIAGTLCYNLMEKTYGRILCPIILRFFDAPFAANHFEATGRV